MGEATRVIPVQVQAPVLRGCMSLGLTFGGDGLAIGRVPRVIGLRITFRDGALEAVRSDDGRDDYLGPQIRSRSSSPTSTSRGLEPSGGPSTPAPCSWSMMRAARP